MALLLHGVTAVIDAGLRWAPHFPFPPGDAGSFKMADAVNGI
jgi:hypothetical protein